MRLNELISAASSVRNRAYAPYSGFAVGAAILTNTGEIFAGCNVENVSLALTLCAERAALAAAISHGKKEFVAIAIVANSVKPATPCGACRQVLTEFNPKMIIVTTTVGGESEEFDLAQLLPLPKQGLFETTRDV